jgi:molybdate transport system substrate-binding protein
VRSSLRRRARDRKRSALSAVGLTALGLSLLLAGCGSSGGPESERSSSPLSSTSPLSSSPSSEISAGELLVFAAASLKTTFTQLGTLFEQLHPGSTATFNFAGSSDLVTQIAAGAPADVLAAADQNTMTKAVDAGAVSGTPVDFAGNVLTIVTQPGNPAGITAFADLTRPDLQVVVCAPQVPCGTAAVRVAQNSGVTLSPVSEELSVTDVLNKVQSEQADAGLVYVTDAATAGSKITEVPFPEAGDAVNVYPIAMLAQARQPALAAEFVNLVAGPAGQQVLRDAGFRPAP